MGEKNRYGIFKVIASCPHCGNPVPVNGPLLRLQCPSCQNAVGISAETWNQILKDYLEDYQDLEPGNGRDSTLIGELTLKYTYIKLPPPQPACTKCETDWDLASITDGMDGVITCRKCGYTSPTYPPPDWLAAGVPVARQVFFGEREVDETSESKQAQAVDEARPIAMTCPQCSGSLLVTPQTERILRCSYCNTDIYLPDALWLKLHPAKAAKFWMIKFQG
jgi:Zn finger protein HypA/HybF involved in hydrogenase expression